MTSKQFYQGILQAELFLGSSYKVTNNYNGSNWSDLSIVPSENGELVSVSFVLFALCLAFVVHLHLLSFEVELITVNGDHAHRAHDLTALRLGGPAENIIQAVVPVGVSLHWFGSGGGPGPFVVFNGLGVLKSALTVLLLLALLGARLLFSGGSRRCLAPLHDIVNDLRVRDKDIA